MNASELKYRYQVANPDGYFFNSKSMKFFGDTMANYGVRSNVLNGVECWELYRKRPVKCGLKSSHFFSKETFKKVR